MGVKRKLAGLKRSRTVRYLALPLALLGALLELLPSVRAMVPDRLYALTFIGASLAVVALRWITEGPLEDLAASDTDTEPLDPRYHDGDDLSE